MATASGRIVQLLISIVVYIFLWNIMVNNWRGERGGE